VKTQLRRAKRAISQASMMIVEGQKGKIGYCCTVGLVIRKRVYNQDLTTAQDLFNSDQQSLLYGRSWKAVVYSLMGI
jgi:hypothetical protein